MTTQTKTQPPAAGEAAHAAEQARIKALTEALTYCANKARTLQGWKMDPGGHEVTIADLADIESNARSLL